MVDTTRQVTLSTTAAEIIQLDVRRTAYSIVNTDPTIIVYISTRPDVSSTNGYPIYPRNELRFNAVQGDDTVSQRSMIAASGSPVVAIIEEHARGT